MYVEYCGNVKVICEYCGSVVDVYENEVKEGECSFFKGVGGDKERE